MSSSRGVGLYLTLLLALLCDALADDITPEEQQSMWQRQYIPDLSKLMVFADMAQREDTNFHPENVPRVFGPTAVATRTVPEVDFPPAFPNAGNLQDICLFSKAPVRYPKNTFPWDGFSHKRRQADTINQLQSSYGVCCGLSGKPEEQISCAEQAWKKRLSAYCAEELSLMVSHYFCCLKDRRARWKCFDKEALDTSYRISSEVSNGNKPKKSRLQV